MPSDEILDLLDGLGAIETGHFELSSGLHSDTYVQKFRALENPPVALDLGGRLAEEVTKRLPLGSRVDVVVSPAVGGMILGFTTASALGARFIFTERQDGIATLRRGFAVREGETVLVVDDVLTTGKSVKEVLDLVRPDQLVGLGVILDRSHGVDLGTQTIALADLQAPSFPKDSCPMCAHGLPITTPGSRFIASDQPK